MEIRSSYSYDSTRFPHEMRHQEVIIENEEDAKMVEKGIQKQIEILNDLTHEVELGINRMQHVTKAPSNLGNLLDVYA